jgi:PAS domain S-box-containing protein
MKKQKKSELKDFDLEKQELLNKIERQRIELEIVKDKLSLSLENELRYSRALDATSDGLYDMNVLTGTAHCNSRYYTMCGYELYELPPSIETWLFLMHPDDIDEALFKLNEQISQNNEFLENEYRLKHKDGHWVWILDRSRIMEYDESGNPLRIVGTHIDITERKLAQDKIKNLLHEKEIILVEVNHRIKNTMLTVQFLLQNQSDRNEDPLVKNILLDASNRIKSMAVLYDKLYRSENITEVSVKEFLLSLIPGIVSVFPGNESIKINTDIENIILHARILSPLGMIVNELITNSIKYAFTGCNDCSIAVRVFRKENSLSVIYQDNGIGIPDSITFENSEGYGMQLIRMLTEQIDGKINIERGNGTKFILEFNDFI